MTHGWSLTAYRHLPALAQDLVISSRGLFLQSTRFGRAHENHVRFLEESESWSEEHWKAWATTELRRLLTHAWGTVPYYRTHWPADPTRLIESLDDLQQLPFLPKEDLKRNPSALRSHALDDRAMITLSTSGTTGTPSRVFVDRKSRQENYAYFERMKRWAGVPARSRGAVFGGRLLGGDEQLKRRPFRRDLFTRIDYFSSYHISEQTVPRYVKRMRQAPPMWIESYPSALWSLARLAKSLGFELPRPCAIFVSSESFSETARVEIGDAFGAPIVDFYGSAEQAALISQCAEGSYHVHPEFGLVEFVPVGRSDLGEELVEIVATSFRNWAMPIVRLRTADLAVRGSRPCSCGRWSPHVLRVVGREYDVITTPDGRWIAGIGPALKDLAIEESQLVQYADDAVEFRMIPRRDAPPDLAERARKRIEARLGTRMKVRVSVVESIPRGPNGKFRMTVNLTRSLSVSDRAGGVARREGA